MRQEYLEAAEVTARLLAEPAVAGSWHQPSALPKLTVAGLAGHLARQLTQVHLVLSHHPARRQRVVLLDHYARSRWVDADLDDEANVSVRQGGETEAAEGHVDLTDRVRDVLGQLPETLPREPADRVVDLPWTSWSLSLDDFLTTRLLEIAVHSDDLAVSVGVPTPSLAPSALRPVLALLTELAVRRHGAVAVLRTLSRAERAPGTIAAI